MPEESRTRKISKAAGPRARKKRVKSRVKSVRRSVEDFGRSLARFGSETLALAASPVRAVAADFRKQRRRGQRVNRIMFPKKKR